MEARCGAPLLPLTPALQKGKPAVSYAVCVPRMVAENWGCLDDPE